MKKNLKDEGDEVVGEGIGGEDKGAIHEFLNFARHAKRSRRESEALWPNYTPLSSSGKWNSFCSFAPSKATRWLRLTDKVTAGRRHPRNGNINLTHFSDIIVKNLPPSLGQYEENPHGLNGIYGVVSSRDSSKTVIRLLEGLTSKRKENFRDLLAIMPFAWQSKWFSKNFRSSVDSLKTSKWKYGMRKLERPRLPVKKIDRFESGWIWQGWREGNKSTEKLSIAGMFSPDCLLVC